MTAMMENSEYSGGPMVWFDVGNEEDSADKREKFQEWYVRFFLDHLDG